MASTYRLVCTEVMYHRPVVRVEVRGRQGVRIGAKAPMPEGLSCAEGWDGLGQQHIALQSPRAKMTSK